MESKRTLLEQEHKKAADRKQVSGSKKKKRGAKNRLRKKKGTLPLPVTQGKVHGSSYVELKLPIFR